MELDILFLPVMVKHKSKKQNTAPQTMMILLSSFLFFSSALSANTAKTLIINEAMVSSDKRMNAYRLNSNSRSIPAPAETNVTLIAISTLLKYSELIFVFTSVCLCTSPHRRSAFNIQKGMSFSSLFRQTPKPGDKCIRIACRPHTNCHTPPDFQT